MYTAGVRGQNRFPHLLSAGRIGRLETRNRIVMSPMGTNLGEEDGRVSERQLHYYEERARGGAGLVIVGVAAVAYPHGQAIPRQTAISDDRFLPGLTELAARIRRHGARAAVQLQHAGKVATQDIAAGRPLMVPSVIPYSGGGMEDLTFDEVQRLVSNLTAPGAKLHYHELTREDVAGLVATFAAAAERAKRAGFDGVEIHAGHGYVISAFLSRAANLRTDAYGGSAENRARFLVEVIRAAKEATGGDFPVWCRLDAHEYRIENGITLEECRVTAKLAEEAGADAVHVSAYGNPFSGIAFTEAPLVHEPGGFLKFAGAIKRDVSVPVLAVGRITPGEGERVLREGQADFIAMGRRLLADPELPAKLSAGQEKDIRPCVYCYTCVGNIFVNESVACAVNPATGHEEDFDLSGTERPRKVLVVGGGPAGMEAARVAALRGHEVILCEKGNHLGGALFFASLLWEPNGDLLDYLERQISKLRVDVRLPQEVTPDYVAGLQPDAVIVASGAGHEHPHIPGIDGDNVFGGNELRQLLTGGGPAVAKLPAGKRALLKAGGILGVGESRSATRRLSEHWLPFGQRIVVIGGGLVGIELAEFFADRDRTTTILEEGEWLAPEMAIPRRWRSLHRLREHGATLVTGAKVEEITAEGVFATVGGERKEFPADHVILAKGTAPNQSLAEALRAVCAEVHVIGDCTGVGYLQKAIAEGARAGREV